MENLWPAVGAIIAVLGVFQAAATLYVRYLILQHVQTCPWPEKLTQRVIVLEQKVDRHLERNQPRDLA